MFNMKKIMIAGVAIVAALQLTACGGAGSGINPKIDGITGPDVELVNGRLLLSMVFNNIHMDGGATIPIKKYPNSSLQVGPDFQSNGTLLVLTIAVPDYLGNQGAGLDPQSLPGGRPLPSVAAGVMPAIAIQVPQLLNSVFYVGPEVLGFFVPFKGLDLAGSILSFRFYDKAQQPVGIVALVGSDTNGQNAGILAMMRADLLGILKKPSASTMKTLAQMY